jgi:hypothetical protein
MQSEMAPRQPVWRLEPKPIELPIERIVEGPYPDDEIAISFKSNGETKSTVVPSNTVDRDKKTVKALIVGEAGDYSLVALPAGSSGGTLALIRTTTISASVG